MPHYFFHLEGGAGLDADEAGVELPDLAAARVEARRTLASLLRDAALTGTPPPWHTFVVADADGVARLRLPFLELFGLAPP